MLAWLSNNWMQLLVAVLAIDAALIPLFPDVGILKKIKDVLSGLLGNKTPPSA